MANVQREVSQRVWFIEKKKIKATNVFAFVKFVKTKCKNEMLYNKKQNNPKQAIKLKRLQQ